MAKVIWEKIMAKVIWEKFMAKVIWEKVYGQSNIIDILSQMMIDYQ